MRNGQVLSAFVGASAAIAFLATCGVEPVEAAGDAGATVCDCPAPPEIPQPLIVEAPCTTEAVLNKTPGERSTTTEFYAEVAVPGLDPTKAPHVSVMLCEATCLSAQSPNWGPCTSTRCGGTTCPEGGWQPPEPNCRSAESLRTGNARLVDGKVVVLCGSKVFSEESSLTFGSTFGKAIVRVGP